MQTEINLKELARKAMRERGLWTDYSPAALEEISYLNKPDIPTSDNLHKDLRSKLFFSIDNDDSRDLDQLTYAESLPNGHFKIYVAVADVDSLVKQNSAINEYAQHNTVSVYTPTTIFAMLPDKLSTNLTSLNEDEDRLAIIAEVDVSEDGAIGENNQIYPAIVRNQAKLAYNGIGDWLEGKAAAPNSRIHSIFGLKEQIKLQDKIAQLLRQKRFEKGSLTLETIESRPIVKENQVVEIEIAVFNRARILIEDFMIAANTAASRYLKAHKQASIRRVVRTPKKWERIVEIAAERGQMLPVDPDAIALNSFLIKQRELDPLRFPDLSLTIIKLLGRGEYVVEYPGQEPIGHFNLAVKDYTHSTAPNRRFPDLITQRLLKSIIFQMNSPYTIDELERLARHCTAKETDADKVERKLRKSATILLLYSKMNQNFNALVTGAGAKGTWVRIFDPPAEGKLVQGFQGLDVGDQIQVKLVHLNIELGFIDFAKI